MKKTVAILLAFCLLFALSGCVSRRDVDEAAAQRDALQAKAEPHSEFLQPLMEEEYEVVLDMLEEKQADKERAAAEMIEPYLVTVELTTENFDDYFEWITFPSVDAFGAEDGDTTVVLTCKVYQDGLVFYRSDAKYVLEDHSERELNLNSRSTWHNDSLPDSMKVVSVSGSVTFVKSDYVMEYSVEKADPTRHTQNPADPFLSATVTLANGESFYRSIIPGCEN